MAQPTRSLQPKSREMNQRKNPDWGGISDNEETEVQVVEHTEAQARTAAMSKEELKSFMV